MENEQNLTIQPTPEEINSMRIVTGETSMANEGSRLPYLDFNGRPDGGIYSKVVGKDDKNKSILEPIGETVEGVIVRIRKVVQTGLDSKQKLYSSEFDNYTEQIDVYDRSDTKNPVYTGTYHEIIEKYHGELRLQNVIYLFLAEETQIYKMRVTGGSLSNFWNYLRQFTVDKTGKKDTILKYITRFGSINAVSQNGLPYKQMTFEKVGETPQWKEIWQELESLNAILSTTAIKKVHLLTGEVIADKSTPDESDIDSLVGDPNAFFGGGEKIEKKSEEMPADFLLSDKEQIDKLAEVKLGVTNLNEVAAKVMEKTGIAYIEMNFKQIIEALKQL